VSLIKKIDVEKYFAERRAIRLGRMLPLGQLGTTWIKSAAKKNKVAAAAEALPLGQSSPSVSIASIPIASGSAHNRLLRPPASRQQ
jgi:hypothetical protein